MKYFLLIATITATFVGGCSNHNVTPAKSVRTNSGVTEIQLTFPQAEYPLERTVRLVFDISSAPSAHHFEVQGYMKCCKSPVELSHKVLGDTLAVDVTEFWSPGIYVFEVIAFDANGKEIVRTRSEVQAK